MEIIIHRINSIRKLKSELRKNKIIESDEKNFMLSELDDIDKKLASTAEIEEEQIITEFQKTLDIGRSFSEENVISVIWHDNVLKMKGGRMYKKILEFLVSQDDVMISKGMDIMKHFII